MSRPLIYLTGGDTQGWALDSEIDTTRSALNFVVFTNIIQSSIIHSVYWPKLLTIPRQLFLGKKVICHMTHDPRVAFENPNFEKVTQFVTLWIAHSTGAKVELEKHGLKALTIPYILDNKKFFPLAKNSQEVQSSYDKWNIPRESYLIGSFQRDTEGADLSLPKLMKGPDIFLDIVRAVYKEKRNIHVILAGPRRFWLKKQLSEAGIPFTYIGKEITDRDDYPVNILAQEEINVLYNLIDIYLVTSRLEGGPVSILEASAAKCKILSTDVGIARDILSPKCLYNTASEANDLILRDISSNMLADTVNYHFETVKQNLPENVRKLWKVAYQEVCAMPVIERKDVENLPGLKDYLFKRLKRYLR
jgi:glycosyltransferase involved in cell wall biosynthesis